MINFHSYFLNSECKKDPKYKYIISQLYHNFTIASIVDIASILEANNNLITEEDREIFVERTVFLNYFVNVADDKFIQHIFKDDFLFIKFKIGYRVLLRIILIALLKNNNINKQNKFYICDLLMSTDKLSNEVTHKIVNEVPIHVLKQISNHVISYLIKDVLKLHIFINSYDHHKNLSESLKYFFQELSNFISDNIELLYNIDKSDLDILRRIKNSKHLTEQLLAKLNMLI